MSNNADNWIILAYYLYGLVVGLGLIALFVEAFLRFRAKIFHKQVWKNKTLFETVRNIK